MNRKNTLWKRSLLILLAFVMIAAAFPLNVLGSAPNLPQPGERLAAGIEDSATKVMNGYNGVRITNHPLWRLANIERYEVIISGDIIEFNDGYTALIYANGFRSYPIREKFADGERLTFYVDHSQNSATELYVHFRTVTGTMESTMLTLAITHEGVRGEGLHAADIFYEDEKTGSPYQPMRPVGIGSVQDVLIAHPVSNIPRSTIPVELTSPSRVYNDVPYGHWAVPDINSVVRKGLMFGTRNDRFDPGVLLTRAEAAQVLYRAYASGMPYDDTDSSFQDVNPDAWYADAVAWVGCHDIVPVPPNGSFRPNELATREFVADMLYRVSLKLDVPLPATGEAAPFTDALQITNMEAVQAMQRAGVIRGYDDGSFGPDDTILRAQMAAMIDRFTNLPGLAPMLP
jgi:hypothetical protein